MSPERKIHLQIAETLVRSKWRNGFNVEMDAGQCDTRGHKVYADFIIYDDQYIPKCVIEVKASADIHSCMEAIGQLTAYCHILGLPLSKAIFCVPMTEGIPSGVAGCMTKLGIKAAKSNYIVDAIKEILA